MVVATKTADVERVTTKIADLERVATKRVPRAHHGGRGEIFAVCVNRERKREKEKERERERKKESDLVVAIRESRSVFDAAADLRDASGYRDSSRGNRVVARAQVTTRIRTRSATATAAPMRVARARLRANDDFDVAQL